MKFVFILLLLVSLERVEPAGLLHSMFCIADAARDFFSGLGDSFNNNNCSLPNLSNILNSTVREQLKEELPALLKQVLEGVQQATKGTGLLQLPGAIVGVVKTIGEQIITKVLKVIDDISENVKESLKDAYVKCVPDLNLSSKLDSIGVELTQCLDQ